ncbi:MAG: hypothetical protein MUO77_08280, partial [Anaerolineales bacterium]|nr:hypothetical protein [Anaerolineales bacterium]
SILLLWLALILQISVIIFLDLSNGYFFALRQIIHLTPMVMLLTSISFMELLTILKSPPIKTAIIILMTGTLGFSSIPYIDAIHHNPKGGTREIVQKVINEYHAGQKILVLTSQYEKIFKYYLLRLHESGKSEPIILVAENIEELEYLFKETPNVVLSLHPKTYPERPDEES